MEIDKKIIRKLIEVLEDLKKSLNGNEIINNDEPIEEKIDDPKTVIKSPIVGTAYLASEPGAKPFVSVGKKIKKGETVLIVEANEEWWKRYENEFWEKYEKTVNEQTTKEPDRGFTKKRKEFELKVDVDQSLCIGCCSCEIIAPEVFTIDKNTKSNPKSRVYNKKGAKNQKIINAAETCPTKAIIVDNLDENERIYPY